MTLLLGYRADGVVVAGTGSNVIVRQIVSRFRTLSTADSRMKARVAAFTRYICAAAAAADGDRRSRDIVERQAEDLADLTAQTLTRNLSAERRAAGLSIVECGGLLANSFYRPVFRARLTHRLGDDVPIRWCQVQSGLQAAMNSAQSATAQARTWQTLPPQFRPAEVTTPSAAP